jgi:hypothetical protein
MKGTRADVSRFSDIDGGALAIFGHQNGERRPPVLVHDLDRLGMALPFSYIDTIST